MIDYDVLAERLHYYAGAYESHITVLCDEGMFDRFSDRCQALDAKAIVIELNVGDRPVQPMLCKRHLTGSSETLSNIVQMIGALSEEFEVERVKVEASLNNRGIPLRSDSAVRLPADCYFEHHVKLDLPNGFDDGELRNQVRKFSGHLSLNPLHTDKSRQRRFITQRFYNSTENQASLKLKQLEEYLEHTDFDVLQVIREFNIYDSNIDRDRGWMR